MKLCSEIVLLTACTSDTRDVRAKAAGCGGNLREVSGRFSDVDTNQVCCEVPV